MATDQSTIGRSVLLRQFLWPFILAFWVLFVGVCLWGSGVLAQMAWAEQRAPANPLAYQTQQLQRELDALATLTPVVLQPSALAQAIGDAVHNTAVWAATGVLRTLMNIPGLWRDNAANDFIRHHPDPGGAYAQQMFADSGHSWQRLVVANYTQATRTAMFMAMLPLLALTTAIGLIDGLMARARRRANAGRESASLYHRAKLGSTGLLITGYLGCLAVPSLTQPVWVLVPLAVGVGGLVRVQGGYFKKYL
ncbi:MAG: hypothetical protein C4K60_20045 [Ideonella sp. MAG2]|nr:MAG: hypothetical protein C4K60_20045 [Ideonella sp. MAG2]